MKMAVNLTLSIANAGDDSAVLPFPPDSKELLQQAVIKALRKHPQSNALTLSYSVWPQHPDIQRDRACRSAMKVVVRNICYHPSWIVSSCCLIPCIIGSSNLSPRMCCPAEPGETPVSLVVMDLTCTCMTLCLVLTAFKQQNLYAIVLEGMPGLCWLQVNAALYRLPSRVATFRKQRDSQKPLWALAADMPDKS